MEGVRLQGWEGGRVAKRGGGGMKKMGRHEGWKSSNEGEN